MKAVVHPLCQITVNPNDHFTLKFVIFLGNGRLSTDKHCWLKFGTVKKLFGKALSKEN